MNKNSKTKKRTLVRWFSARLLCLIHLIVSAAFLFFLQFSHHLFYLPIIGITLISLEIVVFCSLQLRFEYSSALILTYSLCIISSIWLLESYKINILITAKDQQAVVEVFSVIYYSAVQSHDKFFLDNKYMWAELQIQVYIFIIVLLKGLCEKEGRRLDIIAKTWASGLDTIDFISLLDQSTLYSDRRFVYITLSVWSLGYLQFLVSTSMMKKLFLKCHCRRLAAVMTYPLLSMIVTDIPYLIIRLYTIFGVTNHSYTSYFLVFKNIFVIVLQIGDTWSAYKEDVRKRKNGLPTVKRTLNNDDG